MEKEGLQSKLIPLFRYNYITFYTIMLQVFSRIQTKDKVFHLLRQLVL